MIDEKKIKEATNNELKSVQEDYVDDELGILYPTDHKDIDSLIRDVFADGVYWAISEFNKSLWHDASEEPEQNNILVYSSCENRKGFTLIRFGDLTKALKSFIDEGLIKKGCKAWENVVQCFEVTKWCYLSDILPKEGGEE